MRILLAATVMLLAIILTNCHRASIPPTPIGAYATRDGRNITVQPYSVSFRVPQQWLEWNDQFHNNFHLGADLKDVRNGGGEWDTEYAQVVNAALPFEYCAIHAGGDGWGKQGSSFADVQMRVYDTPFTNENVLNGIRGGAFNAAKRISSKSEIVEARDPEWQSAEVNYFLWYGDYGGTARVRFYLHPVGSHTIVFVFMGGDEKEVRDILNSVSFPQK